MYIHPCFTIYLLGMCEALWQPDMSPEEIFECIAQALTNALDRDASSGKYEKYFQICKKKNQFIFQFLFLIFFFQF